ncbi:hypothetical protein [Pseudomonas umsongensis]|uniref:hypothetical protein n=1 Tax=Pseudomonas umsongensis TaxID=198618 RepID=UPI00200B629D|nr:hypothetical protein [Pseudomonas umsongensis]MCK8654642.1 hypothetical protein [Pseudomonas umsongensis]
MNVTIEIDNQAPQKNNLMDLASDLALGKTVVESEAKGAHDFYRSNGKGRGVPDLIQKKTKHVNFNW